MCIFLSINNLIFKKSISLKINYLNGPHLMYPTYKQFYVIILQNKYDKEIRNSII